MHELALTQSIVDLATACARQEGLHKVTRVVVEVGAASGVEPDSLSFCFDIVAADTMARGAELHIDRIDLWGACGACGNEFHMVHLASPCPECGAYGPRLLHGRELRVKSIDGE